MYRDAKTFQTISCRSRNAALSVIPRSGVVGKRLCHIITSCKLDDGVIHTSISSVCEGNEGGGAKRLKDYQQGRVRVDTVMVRTKVDSRWTCSKQSHGAHSRRELVGPDAQRVLLHRSSLPTLCLCATSTVAHPAVNVRVRPQGRPRSSLGELAHSTNRRQIRDARTAQ